MATLGWSVIHACWLSTLVGLPALLWLASRRGSPATRHIAGMWVLVAMAAAPVVVSVTRPDPLQPTQRRQLTETVSTVVTFESFVSGRRAVVPIAGAIWLAGVVVGLIQVGSQWRRLAQYRRTATEAPTHALSVASDLQRRMGMSSPVAVASSTIASVPMVFGWTRPHLLLPHALDGALSSIQLRGILAHELAHVRRRDFIVNVMQVGLDVVLWFHPCARWISRQVRTEREYCCDDEAIREVGSAAEYAHALATIDDRREEGSLAVAAASGTLLDRIARLAGRSQPRLSSRSLVVVVLVASIATAVVFALAHTVPPGVALDAQLRQRQPAPPGVMVPDGPSLPRSPQGR